MGSHDISGSVSWIDLVLSIFIVLFIGIPMALGGLLLLVLISPALFVCAILWWVWLLYIQCVTRKSKIKYRN